MVNSHEREVGVRRKITRRDFMNGVAAGTLPALRCPTSFQQRSTMPSPTTRARQSDEAMNQAYRAAEEITGAWDNDFFFIVRAGKVRAAEATRNDGPVPRRSRRAEERRAGR